MQDEQDNISKDANLPANADVKSKKQIATQISKLENERQALAIEREKLQNQKQNIESAYEQQKLEYE